MGVEWAWRWAGRGEGAAATHGPRRTRRLRAAARPRPRPHPMSHVACALFHVHHSLFDPSSCPALGQLLKTRANRRHGRAATMVGRGPARCSALPYAGRPPITPPVALLPARLCLRLCVRCRQPGPEAWPVCPSLARTTQMLCAFVHVAREPGVRPFDGPRPPSPIRIPVSLPTPHPPPPFLLGSTAYFL